jgi:putative transposase
LKGEVVHTADTGERAGAKLLLTSLKNPLVRLKKILVDRVYSGAEMTDWVKEKFNWIWEVSKSSDNQREFIVKSKRWGVERTFAWLGKCRRLGKDYEYHAEMSESFIYLALIRIMLRNLTPVNS